MLISFLGFFNVYAMRVNMSVAIVVMVNRTAISGGNGSSSSIEGKGSANLHTSSYYTPFPWWTMTTTTSDPEGHLVNSTNDPSTAACGYPSGRNETFQEPAS